jgi:hypothetical protein
LVAIGCTAERSSSARIASSVFSHKNRAENG